MHLYASVAVYAYAYVYVDGIACARESVYVCMPLCLSICLSACLAVCVYPSVYLCASGYIYTQAYTLASSEHARVYIKGLLSDSLTLAINTPKVR